MAFADLASNQMVSFTDAQSGGFAINSAQTNITSDQCMTKNDALTKYNLDASYMSSYSDNQLVPKSTWVGISVTSYAHDFSLGYFDAYDSCLDNFSYYTFYSADVTLIVGSRLFTDSTLTFYLNGGNNFFRDNNQSNTCRVDSLGYITTIAAC